MIFRDNTKIWAEKYRPRTINDYVCSDDFQQDISDMIEHKDIPHMLLCGTPGIGKTALAKMLINELDAESLIISTNESMNMDAIRNQILPFCQSVPEKDLKIILLEEFHRVPIKQQESLNYIIETYSDSSRFLLTCNYSDRILPSIKSRCKLYDIVDTPKEDIMARLMYVMDNESIKYDSENPDIINGIVDIINNSYPDMRSMYNELQSKCISGEYKLNNKNKKTKDELNILLTIMKSTKSNTEKIKSIRQFIADERITNFNDIYKYISTNIESLPGDMMSNIILIGQYQYQDYFSLDKEINIMSMFSSILTKG